MLSWSVSETMGRRPRPAICSCSRPSAEDGVKGGVQCARAKSTEPRRWQPLTNCETPGTCFEYRGRKASHSSEYIVWPWRHTALLNRRTRSEFRHQKATVFSFTGFLLFLFVSFAQQRLQSVRNLVVVWPNILRNRRFDLWELRNYRFLCPLRHRRRWKGRPGTDPAILEDGRAPSGFQCRSVLFKGAGCSLDVAVRSARQPDRDVQRAS